MDRPVLSNWLALVMAGSVDQVRAVEESLGDPIFGIVGPLAGTGIMNQSRGGECHLLRLRYDHGDGRYVEVTTGTCPLGGTDVLVQALLVRAMHGVTLPFSLTVSERLLMLPVLGVSTQFRVVEASDGHWLAAGGFKKRHLLLGGSPGTTPDEQELTAVTLP